MASQHSLANPVYGFGGTGSESPKVLAQTHSPTAASAHSGILWPQPTVPEQQLDDRTQ